MAFIPLLVAIDVFAVVPFFVSLTDRMSLQARRRLVTEATLTSLVICIVFLVAGRFLFGVLGITENDFRVGGGVVLLVIAISDLLFSHKDLKKSTQGEASIGVVPIGIPLIIGPAALTTILMLVNTYGYVMTVVSLIINLVIVWSVFRYSDVVVGVMGRSGSKAVGKVASLFMTAIAVMMIRVGITNMLR